MSDLDEARTGAGPRVLAGTGLLAAAVVLTALTMRSPVSAVGPMLGALRDSLGASATWAGVLTTLPGLCFAAGGLFAPWVARRTGISAAVAAALAVLTAGLVVRVLGGSWAVLGGTLVVGAGIAVANVLIPVVIKESFTARIGLVTGLYTAAMQGGAAAGSAATPALASALGGWRGGLGIWAVLSAVALIGWLAVARTRPGARKGGASPRSTARSFLRSRLAWTVTVFFGLEVCFGYIVMGWLPEVFIDAGVSRGDAGLLLGLISLLGVPISLVVPPLAARQRGQSGWILGLSAFGLAGAVGVLAAPGAAPVLWAVLIGIGMSVFSLAIAVIPLRSRTGGDTARLSGMAQGFGYLFAAAGPFLFGLLRDATESWTAPAVLLVIVGALVVVFGFLAGREQRV